MQNIGALLPHPSPPPPPLIFDYNSCARISSVHTLHYMTSFELFNISYFGEECFGSVKGKEFLKKIHCNEMRFINLHLLTDEDEK